MLNPPDNLLCWQPMPYNIIRMQKTHTRHPMLSSQDIPHNPRRNTSLNQSGPGDLPIHINIPPFIHESNRRPPRLHGSRSSARCRLVEPPFLREWSFPSLGFRKYR